MKIMATVSGKSVKAENYLIDSEEWWCLDWLMATDSGFLDTGSKVTQSQSTEENSAYSLQPGALKARTQVNLQNLFIK